MKIRPFYPSDLKRIEELTKKYPDVQFDRKFVVSEAVIEDENKMIGYGLIRPIAELIMVIDGNKKQIAKGLEILHRQAVVDAALARFDQLHCFVEPDFAGVLKKHYGYRNCNGEVLVRETY